MSVSSSKSFEDMSADVRKCSMVYDWDSASKVIENFVASNKVIDDRVYELLGDSYYFSAFQKDSRQEFKQVILAAKDAYQKSHAGNRSIARSSFCKFYSSDDPDERREIMYNECLPNQRKLVSQMEEDSKIDVRTLANAHCELLEYLLEGCTMSIDRKQIETLTKDAKDLGRRTFERFKSSTSPEITILSASSYLIFLSWASGVVLRAEEFKQLGEELAPFVDTLLKLSELVADSRLKSLAIEAVAIISMEFQNEFERGASLCERALKESEKTRDKYLIGMQEFLRGYSLGWASQSKDLVEDRMKFGKMALESLSSAIENLKVPLAGDLLENSYQFFVSRSNFNARDSANSSEKSICLDRAIGLGREGLQYSGFSVMSGVDSQLGSALTLKAELVSSNDERITLLSEALALTQKGAAQKEALGEHDSWQQGISYATLGNAMTKLSDVKSDEVVRISLLKEGVGDLKKSAEICLKVLESENPTAPRLQQVGRRFESLGETLSKLFNLTHRREDCIDSIKAFENSSRYFSQANLKAYVPPITWKIAGLYDSITEYSKSSITFEKASTQYKAASTNQKSLEKSFAELSLYLKAWARVEESRQHHAEEDYLSSAEKLREATSLLLRAESFRYLARHYEAYSETEQAEDESRKEKNQEASLSFGLASDLFKEAEEAAREHGKESDDQNWVTLSKNRGAYCLARKSLEEAKLLDRNGQAEASMRKYKAASDALKELVGEASKQGNVSDVEALSLSCEAFAIMKEAEIKSSSELYSKASSLFVKAKENNLKQSFVLSCLANSSICDALEAGTRFKKTSEVNLYSEIKTRLGAASRYYEEAGFEIASEWTRATEALFDALAYLSGAEREIDSQKRIQMYHLAEKHLELSARRYGDIGYDKKRQEVLRNMKTARENRELLITPMEALSQSPTVSAIPVSFTRDQAAGLERYEVANLTGNITISTKKVKVGSPIRIDIDIANVGKTPALIMKLENVAPGNIFEPEDEKDPHHFLRGGASIAIDLKGKRLEYMKGDEINLHLIARSKGTFEIKPKILFVDELGKFRSYEFEPQMIEVNEEEKQSIPIGSRAERRLAAVMFTDIAEYTTMSQKNETLALELLEEHRKLIRPFFAKYSGKEIKTIGDAFLVEFSSSLEAVRCAIDIQKLFIMYNSSLSADRQIRLRIGIHLGDVVHSQSDIYGDAVNVASRIEPLASPGEICISEQVYLDVRNKILASSEFLVTSLGKVDLKHVEPSMEVYKIGIVPS